MFNKIKTFLFLLTLIAFLLSATAGFAFIAGNDSNVISKGKIVLNDDKDDDDKDDDDKDDDDDDKEKH